MDKDDDERLLEFIEKQVDRASQQGEKKEKQVEFTEFQRANEEEKVTLKLNPVAPVKTEVAANPSVFKAPAPYKDFSSSASVRSHSSTSSSSSSKGKRKSALEELREEQEKFKEKRFNKDYWLLEVNGLII